MNLPRDTGVEYVTQKATKDFFGGIIATGGKGMKSEGMCVERDTEVYGD